MSPTILIVDDEDDLREAIAFDFRRKKFNVFTAANGRDALKIVESESIDIVLSDVRMPNGDGIELLNKIKERNVFLPVVMFITGFADITVDEAYDMGADAVFAKPFDRKVLFEAVMRAIQPTERRLLRKATRVDVDIPVGLNFVESKLTIQAKGQNLGRGGMFVSFDGPFPKAMEKVEIRIESGSKPGVVMVGEGVVRWVRTLSKGGLPSGCGIEFLSLDRESLKDIVDLINFVKTKSYIPRK